MNGLKKLLVLLFSSILFASLIGLAVSVSSNLHLKDPAQIESWLEQSKLYDHFVKNATEQTEKADGGNQGGVVDLTDEAVQRAAEDAFTADQIKQYVNTFIESNYDWLEGKTDRPTFEIDLTEAKQSFADKVAKYAVTYTAGLPVCTADQVAAAQAADPLSATCRPESVSPEQVGQNVKQQILTGSFLDESVITADNINPDNNSQAEPYYKKLSRLPQVYQLSSNLPYAFGATIILSILGIIFLASKRRGGLKIITWITTIVGLLLVLNKFFVDWAYNQVEPRIFNNSAIGEVQKSLAEFFNLVESAMTKTEMYFGMAYLVVGIILFIILLATRRPKQKADQKSQTSSEPQTSPADDNPSVASRMTPRSTDVPNSGSQASGTPSLPSAQTRPTSSKQPAKRPKKPRLIQ